MASIKSRNGKEKQPSLFDADLSDAPGLVVNGNSAFSDPAFAANKILPIHRWVPWIAGFSSDFVRNALDNHLNHKGTVLDSFAGVGTTLIEAALSGHDGRAPARAGGGRMAHAHRGARAGVHARELSRDPRGWNGASGRSP